MKSAAVLRREGMADACGILVARRVVASMSLEEWGRHLDLEQVELREAIDRWKAEQYAKAGVTPPPSPKKKLAVAQRVKPTATPRPHQNLPCPYDGCSRVLADERARKGHIRLVHVKVECPECGRICTAGGLGPHRVSHRGTAA